MPSLLFLLPLFFPLLPSLFSFSHILFFLPVSFFLLFPFLSVYFFLSILLLSLYLPHSRSVPLLLSL
ncbi:hypothetical protein RchiOBHm_Chr5g0031181 [Rosa chinensis]|uniref:Uncharacterized protein n=1 Tax=Rosa chinensis TaxID=74649 RepID=A0A2P6QA33_ROSCH|nr:hypothetical protein RchiOBHm_Chr5g0031181 [Rosa chinensis]